MSSIDIETYDRLVIELITSLDNSGCPLSQTGGCATYSRLTSVVCDVCKITSQLKAMLPKREAGGNE